LRLFSFGGYGLALAALALVVFGAYDSYPIFHSIPLTIRLRSRENNPPENIETDWIFSGWKSVAGFEPK